LENSETKRLYRIIAQNDKLTITANTATEMTESEAAITAREDVLSPNGNYRNFILHPLGTLNGWKHGHINFCPRCGTYIADEMGDSSEIANNAQTFECGECEAYMEVNIISTPEENEDIPEEES
jgi:ribosomal protein S27AE